MTGAAGSAWPARPLLRREGRPARSVPLAARTGIVLLLGAAALCALVHHALELDVALASTGAAPTAVSKAPRREDAPADAAPSIDVSPDARADGERSWVRSIPLVGESIDEGIKASAEEAEKRRPVRDEDRVPADKAPKVPVDVYMEAACPGCQFFTTHVLVPVMEEEGMADITKLNIIAGGNAEVKTDEETGAEEVECQHGPGECEGNKIISCLAKSHSDDAAFVPALGCIEQHSSVGSDVFSSFLSNLTAAEMLRSNAGLCLTKADLPAQEIEACSDSPEGEALLRASIQQTAALVPAYEYAPWVLVNGVALRDDAYSLKKYICEQYTGPLPAACASSQLKSYFPLGAPGAHPALAAGGVDGRHDVARGARSAPRSSRPGSNRLFGYVSVSVGPPMSLCACCSGRVRDSSALPRGRARVNQNTTRMRVRQGALTCGWTQQGAAESDPGVGGTGASQGWRDGRCSARGHFALFFGAGQGVQARSGAHGWQEGGSARAPALGVDAGAAGGGDGVGAARLPLLRETARVCSSVAVTAGGIAFSYSWGACGCGVVCAWRHSV